MAGIPNNFLTATPSIASYDYFDLASGIGYKRFYGIVADTSTGKVYRLDQNITDVTGRVSATTDITNTVYYAHTDLDFDLTFTKYFTVGGEGKLYLTIQTAGAGVGQNQAAAYIVATIYHVTAGGTETSLGTAQSQEYNTNIVAGISRRYLIPITITKKNFIPTDRIRVNVIAMCKYIADGAGGVKTFKIYYDPTNLLTPAVDADGVAGDTSLIFDMPFYIDL